MFRGPRGRLAMPTELPSLNKEITYLLYLCTFFKNFVCSRFSFAHRIVYHLRTVSFKNLCKCAATNSIAQVTDNNIMSCIITDK